MGSWNPAKGNRKSGTKPSLKGWRTNKMVIPRPPWLSRDGIYRSYYEDMRGAVEAKHEVHGQPVTTLYQQARDGFSYGCTPDDVVEMFNLLPAEDVCGIAIIAFRQPTRKQSVLNPVWGRLIFRADFESCSGACVMIEATKLGTLSKFSRKQSIGWTEELDRLRKDGHELVEDRRGWKLLTSEESIHNTVLYRTVPHEVGHEVDLRSYESDPQYATGSEACEAYWSRPTREREDAAHRYAAEKATDLRKRGLIPFRRASAGRMDPRENRFN